MYDYRENVMCDIREWISDNEDSLEGLDRSDAYELVYDACWKEDSVTGNASGSYTFSRTLARDNFFSDLDSDQYIWDMCEDGFSTYEEVGKLMAQSDWEKVDVYIRCWLLNQCVTEVLDEMDFDD